MTEHETLPSGDVSELAGDMPEPIGRNDGMVSADSMLTRAVHAITAHSSASDPGYEAASNDLDWAMSDAV